jgi:adenine-specific DNA-methyltransferase
MASVEQSCFSFLQGKMHTETEHFSREELVQQVADLQEQVRMNSAFAGVPEKDTNDAILQWRGRNRFLAERIIPVRLKPIASESLHAGKGDHRIIEGDNLAVMTSLLTEFRGGPTRGVDVIYLDPPYNTGEDVFSYNDNYLLTKTEVKEIRRKVGRSDQLVSLDDPSRHTKWINHMAPRLWAARKLLKSTGIVVCSIDEHELPRLWMLMEEIFGEKNRIATLIWDRARKNDAGYISEGHEYMLVWARNKVELDSKKGQMARSPEWEQVHGRWRKMKDGVEEILTAYTEAKDMYGNDLPKIRKAMKTFFAGLPKGHPAKKIRYKKVNEWGMYNDDGDLNWPGGGGPRYKLPHPDTKKACKIPKSGWRFEEQDMLALVNHKPGERDRIKFKKNHLGTPRYIRYLDEVEKDVRTSVINRTGQRAVEVVEAVLGKEAFKNPKDHEMLAELFNLVTWRDENAVILDPYGGSGTTGHAVISMNAEDHGNRRFIMIENGDPTSGAVPKEKFTSQVTAERVRRLITGEWADGKKHPKHSTGFTYLRANEQITREAIMASTRESLADVILQTVEDESNRIDCRVEGYQYVIGRTRLGYGIALVWQPSNGNGAKPQMLTWDVLEQILEEASTAKTGKPIHVYATANTSPLAGELYKFHQIPNSILAKLGILDSENGGAE